MSAREALPHQATVIPSRGGRDRLFRLIAIAIALVGFIAVSVGAELATRYREAHRKMPPDYVPSIFYPHRRLRYGLIPNLDYYGWFHINSLGYRGREFTSRKAPGTIRIACLGASTTFDIGSIGTNPPWPEVLESELQKRLGTSSLEVLNLGIPGATSLDSVIDLQLRVLEFQPDLIIVYQAHNDFIYSIPPPRTRRSTLFPLEDAPRSRLERWLTIHSLLYAKSEARLVGLFNVLTTLPFTNSSVETTPEERNRAIAQAVNTFRNNLRSISAIARANRIDLALPEIAVPFPVGDASSHCTVCAELASAYAGLPTERIRSVFNEYNEVLKHLGEEDQHVVYIPTEGFVPSADRFYHDPVHFGPEGSVLMGQRLAEALVPVIKNMGAMMAPHEAQSDRGSTVGR